MNGIRVEFRNITTQTFPRAPHYEVGVRLIVNVKGKDIAFQDYTKTQLEHFIAELKLYNEKLTGQEHFG